MTHLIDAERLLAAFDISHDPHVPSLVFSLLGFYLESGPFEFDAGVLSHRLTNGSRLQGHVSPETLLRLQPELERYFVDTKSGWEPRPGVLALD